MWALLALPESSMQGRKGATGKGERGINKRDEC